MDHIKTIVAGTDFSDVAGQALDAAAALAQVHGARLVVVHVCEPVDGSDAEDRIAAAAEEELVKAVHRSARPRGVEAEVLVRRGAPWEKIHNVATDVGADLIVIGARGQRGMRRVVGSVAERLVRTTTRPVFIVQGEADAHAA